MKKVQVDRIDKHCNIITYDSIAIAAQSLGGDIKLNITAINNTVGLRQSTGRGFIWRYTNTPYTFTLDALLTTYDRLAIVISKNNISIDDKLYTADIRTRDNLVFTCKVHGNFKSRVSDFMKTGKCIKCSKDSFVNAAKLQFLINANAKHCDKYTYDHMVYRSSTIKIIITCPIHGDFEQLPCTHVQGSGCKECAREMVSLHRTIDNSIWLERFNVAHNNKYTYILPDKINLNTPIIIVCKKHGKFGVTAEHHGSGSGTCPKCSFYSSGFNTSLPATLYYLQIDGGTAYKIGITNRTVNERYSNAELERIKIIHEWDYVYGAEAKLAEQRILKQFKAYKYTDVPLLVAGNTELFSIDILQLDNMEIR